MNLSSSQPAEVEFRSEIIRKQAPYGHACLSCSKAKCRCLAREGSGSCERCHRLQKDCRAPEPRRKRKKVISRMEEKVDGVMSLLRLMADATNESDGNALFLPRLENALDDSSEKAENSASRDSRDNVGEAVSLRSTSTLSPLSPPPTLTVESDTVRNSATSFTATADEVLNSVSSSVFGISPAEAEQYLLHFRTQVLINFAFVHISPRITAHKLRYERPVLFLAIMAVSSTCSTQRKAVGNEIKLILSREILAENEGNLDVLQGLLVFLAWGHDQYINSHNLTSRFMQIAMSIVFDLRLNKSVVKDHFVRFRFDERTSCKSRTMEERRTILGCFVMSLNVVRYFAHIDPLRWTPYMDECLQLLSTGHDCPTDEMFTHQVRLQLIIEKVAITDDDFGQHGVPPAPLSFCQNALISQMLDVQQRVSSETSDNQILAAYFHYTELCIYGIAITNDPLMSNVDGLERLGCFFKCLNSMKCWFDIFMTIPASEYFGISFPFYTQLTHSIILLHRLSTFEDPAWDLDLVRSTVDVEIVIESLIHNLQLLSRGVGRNDGSQVDFFAKVSSIFASVKYWSKSMLIEDGSGINGVFIRQFKDIGIADPARDVPLMTVMENSWLSEELGSWNYDFVS